MAEEASKKKIKILIVDDEPSLRLLVKATLQANSNYEFCEASNGTEAIEIAKQEKPDLMVLDVMMPGLSGFDVCEQIKNDDSLKNITVIMLTAKGQQTDKEWAMSLGAEHFLTKPFSPIELLSLVDQVNK